MRSRVFCCNCNSFCRACRSAIEVRTGNRPTYLWQPYDHNDFLRHLNYLPFSSLLKIRRNSKHGGDMVVPWLRCWNSNQGTTPQTRPLRSRARARAKRWPSRCRQGPMFAHFCKISQLIFKFPEISSADLLQLMDFANLCRISCRFYRNARDIRGQLQRTQT